MESLYLLVAIIGVAALLIWSASVELREKGGKDRSPFAIRSPEDYRQRYGDKLPL